MHCLNINDYCSFTLCFTAVCAEPSFESFQKQSNPAKSLFSETADSKCDKQDHNPTSKYECGLDLQSFVNFFHCDYPGKQQMDF